MTSGREVGAAVAVYRDGATGEPWERDTLICRRVRGVEGACRVIPTKGARDFLGKADTSYSLGFNKPTSKWVFGASSTAFGTPGAGGSFAFADPDTGVGFAYVINRDGDVSVQRSEGLDLRQALFRDVLGVRAQR